MEISAAVAAQVIHGRGAGGEEFDESLDVVAVLALFTENRKVAEDEFFFGLGADRDGGKGEGLWWRRWQKRLVLEVGRSRMGNEGFLWRIRLGKLGGI